MESVVLVTGLGGKEATGLLMWNQRLQILRGASFVVLATVGLFCRLPTSLCLTFPSPACLELGKGRENRFDGAGGNLVSQRVLPVESR